MNDPALIARMSNERLEQNIAALYYEYATLPDGVSAQGQALLDLYWAELDKRIDLGLVKDAK